MTLSYSPLDAAHRSINAKMVPFGGWDMPLQYPTGTLQEHRACRENAVVFDVSHLGSVEVEGVDALDHLQRAFTNDLTKIGPGRAQYTHLLDPSDASVLDDIIIWWVSDEHFVVMPNASNTDRVRSVLGSASQDITATRAVLALQGPKARSLVANIFPEAAAVPRFRVAQCDWQGFRCVVAGTGYTGEDGIEIAIEASGATSLWDAVVDAGFLPAGLGARDTLRLEAGLPLHGHELGAGITPLQAGLGWVVSWTKGDFQGRSALDAERARGVARQLVGLRVDGRRPPRAEQNIAVDGVKVGSVTSGNFSPSLECGIALGLVANSVEVGQTVTIGEGNRAQDALVVTIPFVTKPT